LVFLIFFIILVIQFFLDFMKVLFYQCISKKIII